MLTLSSDAMSKFELLSNPKNEAATCTTKKKKNICPIHLVSTSSGIHRDGVVHDSPPTTLAVVQLDTPSLHHPLINKCRSDLVTLRYRAIMLGDYSQCTALSARRSLPVAPKFVALLVEAIRKASRKRQIRASTLSTWELLHRCPAAFFSFFLFLLRSAKKEAFQGVWQQSRNGVSKVIISATRRSSLQD